MVDALEEYGRRAGEYAGRFGSMDAVHPCDRQVIDSWIVPADGRVLDAGCGPGHWTDYIAGRGLEVRGIDAVAAFIDHARLTHPGVRFDVESMDRIDEADHCLSAILSWYSTIHYQPARISTPIAEFARTLRPGGVVVLGFFDGAAVQRFEHAIGPAYRWPASELEAVLVAHGFDIVETHRRTGIGYRAHGAIVARRS